MPAADLTGWMLSMSRHVVAMGGGGFSMSDDGLASPLDHFVLGLTGRAVPKVCFVGTASGDSRRYIAKFHQAFADLACEPTHLELFRREDTDGLELRGDDFSALLEQDVLYVGGGSTANLLALWRLHSLDRMILHDPDRPTVLCGVSAGALCWFEGGVTDSFGRPLQALPDGLGLVPGSFCPHYDGEDDRRPTYQRAVATRMLPSGLAADDGAAAHVVDGALVEAVSERCGAAVYVVRKDGDGAVEEKLEARRLA